MAFDPTTNTCYTGPESSVKTPVVGNGVVPSWEIGVPSWNLTVFDPSFKWEVRESVRNVLKLLKAV